MSDNMLRGRLFTNQDSSSRSKVAIIHRAFANKYFAHQDPIGKWVRNDPASNQAVANVGAKTIVGVVANDRDINLQDRAQPHFFVLNDPDSSYIAVRSVLAPKDLTAEA